MSKWYAVVRYLRGSASRNGGRVSAVKDVHAVYVTDRSRLASDVSDDRKSPNFVSLTQ